MNAEWYFVCNDPTQEMFDKNLKVDKKKFVEYHISRYMFRYGCE